jgi:hypothetical protein
MPVESLPLPLAKPISDAQRSGPIPLHLLQPITMAIPLPAPLRTTISTTIIAEDLSGNTGSCTAQITVTGLPCGWQDQGGIGCFDTGNTSSFTANQFEITANNCAPEFPYTNESTALIFTELCGDGEIIAEVTHVAGTGYAGVMMRNDLSAGAPMVAMSTNRVNRVRRQVRVLPDYPAFPQDLISLDKFWVRLVRTGNHFQGFASPDGVTWIPYLNQSVFMTNSCIQVGLFAYSEKPVTPLSATFEQVFVTGQNNFLQQQPQNVALGEASAQNENLRVFPNPVKEMLHIDLSSYQDQPAEVQLFNSMGQVVQLKRFDAVADIVQLDVSALVPGMYSLVITIGEDRKVKRVIIGR